MAGTPFGKYLLFDRIAAGGMAEIYRAKYVAVAGVTKNVVIKKILPHYAGNRNFVSMFINEAKIAVGLSHGNIAQIFDFGEIDGEYYLAMEYVHGQTVSRLLRRAKEQGLRIPVPFAMFIAMELCRGLHYAHTRVDDSQRPLNIVHRDISPQNVILSYEGQIKIVDFGIAKVRIAGAEAEKTQAGAIKGKYVYFSPEQARARDLDARTDVFATGIVLFEMLCGRLPFEGKMIEVLNKIVRGDFPRPTTLNPEISPALEEIILKAMAIDREERYASALAFQEALAEHLYSISPKFNQASLAQLVDYLFSDELAAEGRTVQLPDSFLEQVPGWRVDAPRPGEQPLQEEGEIRTSAARRRAMELAGLDEDTSTNSDAEPTHTNSAFLEPRQRFAVAIGLFVLTAIGAGVAVVWFGGRSQAVVRVDSTPAGRVFVDGIDSGESTPHTFTGLKPGVSHPIEIRAQGRRTFATAVLPKVGETVVVNHRLEPEASPAAGDAGLHGSAAPSVAGNDQGIDAPPPSAPAPRALYPKLELELPAGTGSISIPASQAARARLDPSRTYRLTIEGSATLDDHGHAPVSHGCFYFVERQRPSKEPSFGYLGPRDSVRLSDARVLYGFVVDDTPSSNRGNFTLIAQGATPAETVRLPVDSRSNALFPDSSHGARFSALPGKDPVELDLAGALPIDAGLGRPSRAVYWYQRGELGSADTERGVARVGEHVKLDDPTEVVLFIPDDDPASRRGELTAALHPAAAEKAPPRGKRGR